MGEGFKGRGASANGARDPPLIITADFLNLTVLGSRGLLTRSDATARKINEKPFKIHVVTWANILAESTDLSQKWVGEGFKGRGASANGARDPPLIITADFLNLTELSHRGLFDEIVDVIGDTGREEEDDQAC